MNKKILLCTGIIFISSLVTASPIISEISVFGDAVTTPSTSTTINTQLGTQNQNTILEYNHIDLGVQALHEFWQNNSLGLGFQSYINSAPIHITPIFIVYQYHIQNPNGISPNNLYAKIGFWNNDNFELNNYPDVNMICAGMFLNLGAEYDLSQNIGLNFGYEYFNNTFTSTSFGITSAHIGFKNGSDSMVSLGLSYNINIL